MSPIAIALMGLNEIYLIYVQNHEDDCANFGGLLRKAELYKKRCKTVYVMLNLTFFAKRSKNQCYYD